MAAPAVLGSQKAGRAEIAEGAKLCVLEVQLNLTRFPRLLRCDSATEWLKLKANLGLADNTLLAYARGLDDFFSHCECHSIDPLKTRRAEIAAYVQRLLEPKGQEGRGLSNSTAQQRLTSVRLFFDFLVEEGTIAKNPVGRGRYAATARGAIRGLLPRYRRLPWVPSEIEWKNLITCVGSEPVRNRLMFLLAYDCALRREELCSIRTDDLDPALRTLRIRAETTKTRYARVLPYSQQTAALMQQDLQERRKLTRERGPLFVSVSNRNIAQPISIWTWSKVVLGIARRAAVPRFSTHTLRHLCLTDLARAGWEVHEIAEFAGHRSVQSTLLYIHVSGRELAAKLASSMSVLHATRVAHAADLNLESRR
jgi:site-specific recombinase XerD